MKILEAILALTHGGTERFEVDLCKRVIRV